MFPAECGVHCDVLGTTSISWPFVLGDAGAFFKKTGGGSTEHQQVPSPQAKSPAPQGGTGHPQALGQGRWLPCEWARVHACSCVGVLVCMAPMCVLGVCEHGCPCA